MRKIKKFLAVLTAGVMCAGALPLAAVSLPVSAEDYLTYGDLSYLVNSDNTVTITDCDESASGELEIPAEIDGKPVTEVDNFTFSDCTSLSEIVIPDSVTYIGDAAFALNHISEIVLPKHLDYFGGGALNCNDLSDVYFNGTKEQWENIKFTQPSWAAER